MGEDLERKGSLSHRSRSSRDVHPVPVDGVPVYIPTLEKRRISFIVPLIVLANVAMFVITMYVNDCPKNSSNGKCVAKFLGRFSFQPLSENPLIGPSASTLEKLGALVTGNLKNNHQGWRLVSCIWLHAGVAHVAANMMSLLFIGIRLEQEFGFLKIGILYLLSGVGGSLLSALFLDSGISVGASGAVFGLLGATLSELIINWSIYASKCAALISLILVVVVNLAVGILPYVDNFAHIGGFLTGSLLGFVLLLRPQFDWINRAYIPTGYEVASPTKKHKIYQYILFSVSLVIVIVGYVILLVLVFRGFDANKHCSWCHYLNCVPTSKWNCNTNVTCSLDGTDISAQLTCLSNNKTMATSSNLTDSEYNSLCVKLCT